VTESTEPAAGRSSSPDETAPGARSLVSALADRRGLLLAWLAIATVFVFHDAFLLLGPPSDLADSMEDAFFDPQTSSPELGALVFGLLLFVRRRELAARLGAPPDLVGASLGIGGGVLLLLWADSIGATDLARLALALGVLGAGCWLGGRPLARALLPAAFALVLSLPLPLAVLDQVVLPLQLATAQTASWLLSLLGQTHELLGLQILRGDLTFYVIEGCSGLRAIFSLEMAMLLYAELVGRGRSEKLLLLVVAPVVAFFVNAVRVVILVLRELPSDAAEHAVQGVVMIVVGVLLMALLEAVIWPRLFARSRARAHDADGDARASASADPRRPSPASTGPAARDATGRLVALATLATGLAVLSVVAPRPIPTTLPTDRLNVEAVGGGLEGWRAEAVRRDVYFLGSTRFRHSSLRHFDRAGQGVTFFIGAEDRRARDRFGWSPKTRLPGPGWSGIEVLPPTALAGRPIERRIVRYPNRTVFVYHWREGYRPWLDEALRNWLGLDATPWHVTHPSLVLRLETEMAADVAARVEAEQRLRSFGETILHDLDRRLERERERQERRRRRAA
jgi:exosortase